MKPPESEIHRRQGVRGNAKGVVRTLCGEVFYIDSQNDWPMDVGVTVWDDDVTCVACQTVVGA